MKITLIDFSSFQDGSHVIMVSLCLTLPRPPMLEKQFGFSVFQSNLQVSPMKLWRSWLTATPRPSCWLSTWWKTSKVVLWMGFLMVYEIFPSHFESCKNDFGGWRAAEEGKQDQWPKKLESVANEFKEAGFWYWRSNMYVRRLGDRKIQESEGSGSMVW